MTIYCFCIFTTPILAFSPDDTVIVAIGTHTTIYEVSSVYSQIALLQTVAKQHCLKTFKFLQINKIHLSAKQAVSTNTKVMQIIYLP